MCIVEEVKDKINKKLIYILNTIINIHSQFNMLQSNKKLYGYALQNEELCKLAVQQNGLALEFVKKQFKTEELCKLAVQQNGFALEFVNKQTEEVCKLAVQQNGLALYYVKEQFKTEEICHLAVQQSELASKYVKQKSVTNEFCNWLFKKMCVF